jgi:hypothetical protein
MLVDSVKVADATGGSYEINPGISPIVTDGGLVMQVGTTQVTASINTVIPRAGMRNRLYEATLSKRDVQVQILMDSKVHTFTGKLTSASANWDWAGGTAAGAFQFIGSESKLTG